MFLVLSSSGTVIWSGGRRLLSSINEVKSSLNFSWNWRWSWKMVANRLESVFIGNVGQANKLTFGTVDNDN